MLERQIIKYLYDNYPFAIFMTLLLSVLQASVVLNDDNRQVIFYWFIGLIFVQSLRFADYFYFKRIQNSEIYSIYEMFRNFRIGILLTGVLFGSFPVLLITTATITEMVFIAFVFAGITAASISSLGVDRISLISFLTCSLMPLLFCFFSIGGYMPNIMGTMIFFFMIYLMIIGNRFRKQLVANVELTNETLQSKKALVSRQHISELIVKIQSAYLDNKFPIKLFEEVSQEIIELSAVQYCFICRVEQSSVDELTSKVLANSGGLDLSRLNGEALKIDELNLRPLSLEAYVSQVIISREKIEIDHIEMYESDPRAMVIGNFYGLPFYLNSKELNSKDLNSKKINSKVIGLIGFVDLYDTNLKERTMFLNPLFQTIERILPNIDYGESGGGLERESVAELDGGLEK